MSVLDQIMQLKSQGASEDVIINQLRSRGVTDQEISSAMSQSQIKQAVVAGNPGMQGGIDSMNPVPPNQFPGAAVQQGQFDSYGQGSLPQIQDARSGQFNSAGGVVDPYGGQFPPPQPGDSYNGQFAPVQQGADHYGNFPEPGQGQDLYGAYSAQGGDPYSMQEGSGEYSGMQQSMVTSQGAGYAQVGQDYSMGAGTQNYGAEAYPMYQPYQDVMSSDVITEISEQVVTERLSALQDKIEKIIDMRTVVEANMNNLNDRLKRMEQIVDQMQVSILKKVGDYMSDISDVKKELEETQKSFVAIQKSKKSKK